MVPHRSGSGWLLCSNALAFAAAAFPFGLLAGWMSSICRYYDMDTNEFVVGSGILWKWIWFFVASFCAGGALFGLLEVMQLDRRPLVHKGRGAIAGALLGRLLLAFVGGFIGAGIGGSIASVLGQDIAAWSCVLSLVGLVIGMLLPGV